MLSRIKGKLTALCNMMFPEINFLIGKIEDNQRVLLRVINNCTTVEKLKEIQW